MPAAAFSAAFAPAGEASALGRRDQRLFGCERFDGETTRIDFDMGGGAVILGHAHPDVEAVVKAGTAGEAEARSALAALCPQMQATRFLAEESHALPAALSAARRITGRRRAVAWRCAPMPLSEFDDLAALVVDPLGVSASDLAAARRMADAMGAPLIFDEGVSAFRVDAGGAQALSGVTPDLAVHGAAIANGRPLGVVAGRDDLIWAIDPAALTAPRPDSLAACTATLTLLGEQPVAGHLARLGAALNQRVAEIGVRAASDRFFRLGGHITLPTPLFAAPQLEGLWMREMASRGVVVFGPHGLCAAHQDKHIEVLSGVYSDLLPLMAATGLLGSMLRRSDPVSNLAPPLSSPR